MSHRVAFLGCGGRANAHAWVYDRIRDGRFTIWHNRAESVRPVMEWWRE